MKNIVFLSFIFLSLISCAKKNDYTFITPPAGQVDTTTYKTFLALGDSYTIGQSVDASQRFPVQTAELLKQQNINVSSPAFIAVTGWTTGNLLDALNATPPANTYDIVTLLIGVNNQYQGRSLNEYKVEFTELLRRSVIYAGGNKAHVFVISVPDYSVTPYARGADTAKIAREIDSFNEANKAITLNEGIAYVDVTPVSREALYDPSLIAGDGLHPSGQQYKKWSDLLAPVIAKAIK